MPQVTEEFVKKAQELSKAVPDLLQKLEEAKNMPKEASEAVRLQAEVVADTLIQQGLVHANEKSAAVYQLSNHKEALNILNRTAQEVVAPSLGKETEKVAQTSDSDMRDSDRGLLQALGFQV